MDWKKAKADYISNPDSSYRSIASKYGVSASSVIRRGKAEEWVKLKSQKRIKTDAKLVEKIAEKEASKTVDDLDEMINLGYEVLKTELKNCAHFAANCEDEDTQRHRQNTQTAIDIITALTARKDSASGSRQEIVLKGELDSWGN